MAGDQVRRVGYALAALALALGLGGCVSQPRSLYGWGSYEDIVYVAAVKPDAVAPEAQIQQMEKEREMIRSSNQRFPPGWHGHLAYLYARSGQAGLAHDELIAEKAAFPEAMVFCDALLANLAGKTEHKP